MLKKIAKILLIIILVSFIDFILSFTIDYVFKKNIYFNEPFAIYVRVSWFTTGLISLLAVGVTSFVYLFFYYVFVDSKYFNFYKKRGGVIVFFIIAFCFMGAMIFSFATSILGIVNLLRLCTSAWLVTFLITKILEKKESIN